MDVAADEDGDEGDDGDDDEEDFISAILDPTGGKMSPWVHHFTPIQTLFKLALLLLGFPGGSADEESTCNVGDLGSVPGLAGSPGEGKGYPLQYFDLENSRDCIIHAVVKSQTWLSDFHFQVYNIVI